MIFYLMAFSLVSVPWLRGGYFSWVPWLLGITSLASLSLTAFSAISVVGFRKNNPAFSKYWFAWFLLVVLLVVSLLNPSFRTVQLGEGFLLSKLDHYEWLPSVVSVDRSFSKITTFLSILVLGWCLHAQQFSGRQLRRLLLICSINALLLALIGTFYDLAGVEAPLGVFKEVNPSFFASFTYHNHWVAFAGVNLFIASYLSVHVARTRRGDRNDANRFAAFIALCFFLFLSLLVVESRAGVLVAFLYVLCVLWTVGLRKLVPILRSVGQPGLKRRWTAPVAITGLLIILGASAIVISESQLETVSEKYGDAWLGLWDSDPKVNDFRFDQGPKIALELIKDRPIWGWGWGSYYYAMKQYAPLYIDDKATAQYAHNDWLQFFSELGAAGFLLLVLPICLQAFRYFKSGGKLNWLHTGLGVVLLLALFEFPLSNSAVLLHCMIVLVSTWQSGKTRVS
ncbi:O-antigen ligase family protein [Puniceicoccaceae bacterium K14]|nr:O-antigen ligase family protein [Puniceicoccaceae bacterium K14]